MAWYVKTSWPWDWRTQEADALRFGFLTSSRTQRLHSQGLIEPIMTISLHLLRRRCGSTSSVYGLHEVTDRCPRVESGRKHRLPASNPLHWIVQPEETIALLSAWLGTHSRRLALWISSFSTLRRVSVLASMASMLPVPIYLVHIILPDVISELILSHGNPLYTARILKW